MAKKAPEWLNADIQELYRPCQGNIRAIQRAILDRRGQEIAYMTITDRMKRLGLERPRDKSKKAPRETPMRSDETPVEVLDGQMSLTANTPPRAEVYTDAVGEFDALPPGYAKVIQPMREYTEAEDAALKESVRLFGFIGAIVRDQYGRILDGNQRARVAHWFGTGCPYTITEVRDDAHALAVATALNAVRRQYPREQREQIAYAMRDQGFSYRVIAEALGVSKDTVQRDVRAVSHETPAPVNDHHEVETNFTPVITDGPVSHETPDRIIVEAPVSDETPAPRAKGRDRKSYPGQSPTRTKPQTSKPFDPQHIEERIKDLYMDLLRRCEDEAALLRAEAFLTTLRTLAEGRAKLVLQGE